MTCSSCKSTEHHPTPMASTEIKYDSIYITLILIPELACNKCKPIWSYFCLKVIAEKNGLMFPSIVK